MARSHAIWVVTNEQYPWPVAAFTVKRELKAWLEGQSQELLPWLYVWRCENPVYNSGGRTFFHGETPAPTEVAKEDIIGCARDPEF